MRYSIHDILTLKSDIELPYSFFEVNETDRKADISVTVGEVEMPLGSRDIGDWIVGSEGTCLAVDYKFRNSKVSFDFQEGEVNLTEGYADRGSLNKIIRSMIHTKLVERGYGIINCSCLAKNGKTIAISGFHKSGKSSAVLNLPADTFYSDDFLIVDEDGGGYSYPVTTIGIPPGASLKNVHLPISQKFKKRWYALLSNFSTLEKIREMVLGNRIKVRVDPVKSLNMDIGKKCEVNELYLIGLGDEGVKEINPSVGMLVENHTVGSFGFYHHHLLTMYSYLYLNPQKILDKNSKVVKKFLSNVDAWEIKRPSISEILQELRGALP